jgi:hypothetical protein
LGLRSEGPFLFGADETVDCGSPIATSVGEPSAACDDAIGVRNRGHQPTG